jgi:putative mRNA 3-end processing factor
VESRRAADYAGALIIAPFCSGWMRVRGARRRRGYDRGFVLSDHAGWPALLQTMG